MNDESNVALSIVFPSLLTPPLQIQSILDSSLIQTNEVVPESERSRIRSLLQDIESELKNIDIAIQISEIKGAQEHMLLLEGKRAGYTEDMKKLRPGIAPHKYLPPEILIEIFRYYAAEIAEQVIYETTPLHRHLLQFPWVLGQICSRWRQIVLADPRIWGTIGVTAVEYSNRPMLNEAFRRGGQSRLWLSASEDRDYHGFLRDVVGSQSKRITELTLFVFGGAFLEFLSLPSDSFPALEAVELVPLGFPHIPDSVVSVFQGAARLRRIDYIGTQLELIPDSFPMNLCLCWPQLTHITFLDMPIQVSIAHELMNSCTNLRECHIYLEENWETFPPFWIKSHPPSSIRVPYLWRLEIHQDRSLYLAGVFSEFLRPLAMPNLQLLKFSLEEEPDTELPAIVNGLSRRSSLESELLYIGESDCLAEATSALPFVTSLKAPESVLDPSTIRIMAQKDYLPKLTSLVTGVAYADMDIFIAMLGTRWVDSIKARQSGCSTAGIITSAKIYIPDAPDLHSISILSRKIRAIQAVLKLKDAMIELIWGAFEDD